MGFTPPGWAPVGGQCPDLSRILASEAAAVLWPRPLPGSASPYPPHRHQPEADSLWSPGRKLTWQ